MCVCSQVDYRSAYHGHPSPGGYSSNGGRRGPSPDDGLSALGNFSPSALLTPLSIDQSPLMDVSHFGSQMSPCSVNSTSPTPAALPGGASAGAVLQVVGHAPATPLAAPAPPQTPSLVSAGLSDKSDSDSVSNLQVRVSVLQQRVRVPPPSALFLAFGNQKTNKQTNKQNQTKQ